jgi:hypothetical protein
MEGWIMCWKPYPTTRLLLMSAFLVGLTLGVAMVHCRAVGVALRAIANTTYKRPAEAANLFG